MSRLGWNLDVSHLCKSLSISKIQSTLDISISHGTRDTESICDIQSRLCSAIVQKNKIKRIRLKHKNTNESGMPIYRAYIDSDMVLSPGQANPTFYVRFMRRYTKCWIGLHIVKIK